MSAYEVEGTDYYIIQQPYDTWHLFIVSKNEEGYQKYKHVLSSHWLPELENHIQIRADDGIVPNKNKFDHHKQPFRGDVLVLQRDTLHKHFLINNDFDYNAARKKVPERGIYTEHEF